MSEYCENVFCQILHMDKMEFSQINDSGFGADGEYFEVERIVDHATDASGTMYRVRWKGYTESDDTWEEESSFLDPQYVQNYILETQKGPNSDTESIQVATMAVQEDADRESSGSVEESAKVPQQEKGSDSIGVPEVDATNDDKPSSYSRAAIEVYRDDYKVNPGNWHAAHVLTAKHRYPGKPIELLVLWENVHDKEKRFHSWEPESFDRYGDYLKYFYESARKKERKSLNH